MNSDEIWLLQLWSGVFGAAIGALAAAAVALLVVNLTNRHQTRLSAKAIAVQKALADQALQVQREHAKEALNAQEVSLRRQLEEQQAEASRDRQKAAMAEMVSCALELVDRSDETLEGIRLLRHRMTTAWIRFSMEQISDVEDGNKEFFHWPSHLAFLAMDVLDAKIENQPRDIAFAKLNDATSMFATLSRHWLRVDANERLTVSRVLKKARLNPTAKRTSKDFFDSFDDLD